jgi:hypothetical protein
MKNKNLIHIDTEFRNIRRLCPLPIFMPLERVLTIRYPGTCQGLRMSLIHDLEHPRIEGKRSRFFFWKFH